MSTYSREKRKKKLRCDTSGGRCSPAFEVGLDELGVDVLDVVGDALGVGPGLRDFDRDFAVPLMKLRSRLHRFFPMSSSLFPKSEESVD